LSGRALPPPCEPGPQAAADPAPPAEPSRQSAFRAVTPGKPLLQPPPPPGLMRTAARTPRDDILRGAHINGRLSTCGGRSAIELIMCNGTWVCFDCKTAVRRPTWRLVTYLRPWLIGGTGVGRVRCPHCREPCHFLGPTIEMPPKRDVAAWNRLREQVSQLHIAAAEDRFKESVRRRHDLEQRIRELENRPTNPGRDALIKELRAQLAAGG